jgi:acyl-CoA reductase-like NAD-dependent aldehyde dehydrogenase
MYYMQESGNLTTKFLLNGLQIVHEKVHDELVARLQKAYKQIKIGNPLDSSSICGPVHTKSAVKEFQEGLKTIVEQVEDYKVK